MSLFRITPFLPINSKVALLFIVSLVVRVFASIFVPSAPSIFPSKVISPSESINTTPFEII